MGVVIHDVEVKNFEIIKLEEANQKTVKTNPEYEGKHYYVARYESAVEVGFYDEGFQRARSPMSPINESCVVSEAYLYILGVAKIFRTYDNREKISIMIVETLHHQNM
jgi:hypothetical protein